MESVLKLLDEIDDLLASMRHRLRFWPQGADRR
jgi:hypothetical protein